MEVEIAGDPDPEAGWVVDFGDVDEALQSLRDKLDHRLLNEVDGLNRPTLENIIGSFMIFLDKPYRVGQRVKVQGYDGNVEKIGLRSSRIRLRDGSQTIIPNETMAKIDVENVGRRAYIRRTSNITITYDTPVEKVEKAIKIIEDILDNHEGMDPEYPPWVCFNEFNPDSLNIMMWYWYHPPDILAAYAFHQKVNLAIMRAFEKEGIDFAFPTQTLHMAGDEKRPFDIGVRDLSSLIQSAPTKAEL